MNDIEQKREYVIGLYPGPKWRKRVNKMSDQQVTAIYLRKKQGEATLKKEEKSNGEPLPF